MKKSAFFIKGFFKMKWYSTVFKEIKKATITIQVIIFKKLIVKKIHLNRKD